MTGVMSQVWQVSCHRYDMCHVTGMTGVISQVWHVSCHRYDRCHVTRMACVMLRVWQVSCHRYDMCHVTGMTGVMSQVWYVSCHRYDRCRVTGMTCVMSRVWQVSCHRYDMCHVTGKTGVVSPVWHVPCHGDDRCHLTRMTGALRLIIAGKRSTYLGVWTTCAESLHDAEQQKVEATRWILRLYAPVLFVVRVWHQRKCQTLWHDVMSIRSVCARILSIASCSSSVYIHTSVRQSRTPLSSTLTDRVGRIHWLYIPPHELVCKMSRSPLLHVYQPWRVLFAQKTDKSLAESYVYLQYRCVD